MLKYNIINVSYVQGLSQKMSGIPQKIAEFLVFSHFSESAATLSIRSGLAALKGFVNQDNVIPDLLNTVPWDIELLSPAEQAEEAARPINNYRTDLPLRKPKIQIGYISQPAAIADVNDLLAPQIAHPALHSSHLSVSYVLTGMSYY